MCIRDSHRFTVDRHLLEAAANASERVGEVARPDLLVVGALLHDIGKGYPGDHTEVGVELIDTIAPNMGFDAADVRTLKRLCEHHLLLPDAATRRDIEDPGTISSVADQVETSEFLHLLAALTESDSLATGPSAWSKWKAQLMYELVRLTDAWLESPGGVASDAAFPDPDQYELFRSNDHLVSGSGDTITVIAKDRLGVFARVAGALALSQLNILGGQTHVEDGKVLEVITVVDATDEEALIDWPTVTALVEDCLLYTSPSPRDATLSRMPSSA